MMDWALICSSLNPSCDSIWKWDLWKIIRVTLVREGRCFMMSFMPLEGEYMEYPCLFSGIWGYDKKAAICQPCRALTRYQTHEHLILDFPASWTTKNKSLFKVLSPWYFCYSSPGWLREGLKLILLKIGSIKNWHFLCINCRGNIKSKLT
jgi:hypothetical protein